jgi:hypothetical protein
VSGAVRNTTAEFVHTPFALGRQSQSVIELHSGVKEAEMVSVYAPAGGIAREAQFKGSPKIPSAQSSGSFFATTSSWHGCNSF